MFAGWPPNRYLRSEVIPRMGSLFALHRRERSRCVASCIAYFEENLLLQTSIMLSLTRRSVIHVIMVVHDEYNG